MKILVAGEAVVDFFPINLNNQQAFIPKPGGSPFNVAVGLSRLRVPTGFLGKISTDPFGHLLRSYLIENRVDIRYLMEDDRPSSLAFVFLEQGDEPAFQFYGANTADSNLTPADIPDSLYTTIETIHLGSLAMIREPTGSALIKLVKQEYKHRVISFDPNVRPSQIPDRHVYLRKLNDWLRIVDIFKLSQSDASYIFPGHPVEKLANQWLEMGPSLVVVTRGSQGAEAFTKSGTVTVETPKVHVVDSVGAGDAFTAGFLAALFHLGQLKKELLGRIDLEILRRALEFAARAAALTCTKRGADPPWLSELGKP